MISVKIQRRVKNSLQMLLAPMVDSFKVLLVATRTMMAVQDIEFRDTAAIIYHQFIYIYIYIYIYLAYGEAEAIIWKIDYFTLYSDLFIF